MSFTPIATAKLMLVYRANDLSCQVVLAVAIVSLDYENERGGGDRLDLTGL